MKTQMVKQNFMNMILMGMIKQKHYIMINMLY